MRWMHACSSLLNVCPLHTQQWYLSTNNSFITLHAPLQLTPLSTIYDFLSQVEFPIYYKESIFSYLIHLGTEVLVICMYLEISMLFIWRLASCTHFISLSSVCGDCCPPPFFFFFD
ncbi:hypothetical protein DsansV1_C04g0042241 [Dioscorea sansibarensis]